MQRHRESLGYLFLYKRYILGTGDEVLVEILLNREKFRPPVHPSSHKILLIFTGSCVSNDNLIKLVSLS